MSGFEASGRLFGAADVRLGRQRSPQHESGPHMTRYLRAANVKDGALDLADVKDMNFTPAEQGIFKLYPGDVLVTEGSGSLGAVGAAAVWNGEIAGTVCFQNTLLRLRPRPGITDARYLGWWARAAYASGQFAAIASGANIYHLSSERVKGLPVRLPPLNEQRHIADFLDAETVRFDTLIELRNLQYKRLDAHLQSYLSQVAKDLSERYGEIRVRHVLQKIEQGWSPQCEDRPAGESEWGVVKAGCVNGGIFDAAQHKTLPVDVEPEFRYRLRPGDLLMSRASGSVDLIGSIGVIPEEFSSQLLLCDKVYRLQMDRTRMTPHFVALMLGTHQVREKIKLGISGADGMANNLPTATVVKLSLPDVPMLEQSRIVNDLRAHQDSIRNSKNVLARQLSLLAERRQALITAAVTGQIAVTTTRSLSVSEGAAV